MVKSREEIEESLLSDRVFDSVMKEECVDVKDRVYPLDYWVCVLAFTFDIYFKETLEIIRENDYINCLVDRFKYINSKEKMEKVRKVLNKYLDKKIEI